MIHDIAHCNNEKCKKKDKCYRYQAFLELKRSSWQHAGFHSFLMVEDPEKCKDFISLK